MVGLLGDDGGGNPEGVCVYADVPHSVGGDPGRAQAGGAGDDEDVEGGGSHVSTIAAITSTGMVFSDFSSFFSSTVSLGVTNCLISGTRILRLHCSHR